MIVAIDTGGTKTLIEYFDSNGTKHPVAKLPTPRPLSEYVTTVVNHVLAIDAPDPIEAVCIAVPGTIRGGTVSCPNLGWHNEPLAARLQDEFIRYDHGVPIAIENDATLGAVGEARILTSVPDLTMYVTVSTGIGTGLVSNGKAIAGLRRFEGGHVFLEYEGTIQEWEKFASGKRFYEDYGRFGSDIDASETDIWRSFADKVARGLMVLIPTYRPDLLVIGGSMGTHFAKYQAHLHDILSRTLPYKDMESTTIAAAQHPEEAVIYGCYYHAIDTIAAR